LSHIIEEVGFEGLKPAPGYTDYRRIYVSTDLPKDQAALMKKHTSCHIWLLHNTRKPANACEKMWDIATDVEIAINMYDDLEERAIDKPRSFLGGMITKRTLPRGLPSHLLYAEDIYDWLISRPREEQANYPKSLDGEHNKDESGGTKPTLEDIDKLISKAHENWEEVKKDAAQGETSSQNKKQMQNIKEKAIEHRKHSLHGALEAAIQASYVIWRKKSFRRASRRENKDFIQKGITKDHKQVRIIVYCDRSGSFNEEKTRAATQKIAEICQKYRANVKIDVLFFNAQILDIDPEQGQGETNYKAARDNIAHNNPEIAIVITDDDGCEELAVVDAKVLVVPIGTKKTFFASKIGGQEVF